VFENYEGNNTDRLAGYLLNFIDALQIYIDKLKAGNKQLIIEGGSRRASLVPYKVAPIFWRAKQRHS
jgi:hypothetical protein